MNKVILFIGLLCLAAIGVAATYTASEIGPGIFQQGTYAFPSGSKVGIGTENPSTMLEIAVSAEGTRAVRLNAGPNAFLDIRPESGPYRTILDTVNNRHLIVKTGSGNVGIGIDKPSQKLHVAGNVQVDGSICLKGGCRNSWPTNDAAKYYEVDDQGSGHYSIFCPDRMTLVGVQYYNDPWGEEDESVTGIWCA